MSGGGMNRSFVLVCQELGIPNIEYHNIIFIAVEYIHDHKRLFSLYDKGFKLEIHREGVDEKIIQKLQSTKQIIKLKPTVRPKEVKEELEKFNGEDYPLLKNPRIKNIMALHTKGNRNTMLFFLKKGNSMKSFSTEELMDEWGVIHARTIPTKLKPLLDKGHLKKEAGKYRQNLTR